MTIEETPLLKSRPRYGLVAVFDILGYQKFLSANDLEYQIQIASEILNKMPEETVRTLEKYFGASPSGAEIEWRIFSDSIIFAIPLTEAPVGVRTASTYGMVEAQNIGPTSRMLAGANILLRSMFDAGFPLRGSIGIGYYYLDEKWFVGKPLVDAYQDASSQDWSGCVLSEAVAALCEDLIVADDKRRYLFDALTIKCQVPYKTGSRTRYASNWAAEGSPEVFVSNVGHPRDYVMSAFSRHRKNIDASVFEKINNTEAFIWHYREILERS